MRPWQPVVASVLQLVWPARCAGCDALVAGDHVLFCEQCAPALSPLAATCPGCATPCAPPAGRAAGPCAVCARGRFGFTRAFAPYEYGEVLATALIRLKHGDRPDLARRLAPLLAAPLVAALGGGRDLIEADIVVPVPLHPRKLRRRGFNQALALAAAALRLIKLPRRPGDRRREPRLARQLLIRVRDTAELGHAGPRARRMAVAGAFAVSDPTRVSGRRFVIVDDVMTSGATFDECARTLRDAGAAEVRVVAVARAVA